MLITRPLRHTLSSLACACLLYSCNAIDVNNNIDPAAYFHDEHFPALTESLVLESAEQLLELPESMKRQLDAQVMPHDSEYERYKKLRQWAFTRFNDFEFSSLETVSLAELNSTRKINCLSFSALFVAAARYTDVSADFQLVFSPPYWDRSNDSWINNQHINVTGRVDMPEMLLPTVTSDVPDQIAVRRFQDQPFATYRYVADVNPAVVSLQLKREIISEELVKSLFYSNKAVEQLVQDDITAAYAYTKEALLTYPESSLAWNNLGVLYNRVNQSSLAAAAFEQAIALDDRAYSARSNLARLYRDIGEYQRAVVLERQIEEFRLANPYYHAALAEQAIAEGDLRQARRYYENALDRKHNEQHFYHQLAIIHQALGDTEAVLENLRKARRYARGEEKSKFANKLSALERLL